MPLFPYVQQGSSFARRDPLGPSTVNQAHENIRAIDVLAAVEHLSDGTHNAPEIPWVLGHLEDGSPPTGYLFNTGYGGGTLARPATGEYTVSVVSGVMPVGLDGSTLLSSIMANVSREQIANVPHTITAEVVSATSLKFRVRSLTSALGAGNTWADTNGHIDVGLHSLAVGYDGSLLLPYELKQRRSFLTEEATDWNALVQNQGIIRNAALAEHASDGTHNVDRIAKAVAWVDWDGASYSLAVSEGVSSISRISTGIVQLTLQVDFTSQTSAACFPEVQPSLTSELAVINGRCNNSGVGTTTFIVYIYAYDGTNWNRADRSFFIPMFGTV